MKKSKIEKIIWSIIIMMISMSSVLSQKVTIDSAYFMIQHSDLTFYLDKDTCSYISVHSIKYSEILQIDGDRSDKWHKENPYGPYNKSLYVKNGYDLGHLTPSNITSYDDTLNYHSFSMFNQAPQLAGFNRGKWAQLEKKVLDELKSKKLDAIIITGVIYDNKNKKYLSKSRIKIPLSYYKIVVTCKSTICYMGSNENGLLLVTDLSKILEVARTNKNVLNITISK